MVKKYDRILTQLFNQPWVLTEEMMGLMIEFVKREHDIEAVEARLSKPLFNTERAKVRDGIAIIPVSGPIFPKSNLMTQLCGATSIETLAKDLTTAIEDEEVESIILNVDSPGGHVTGINEMANMIRKYSAIKPIHGYSGGSAASGGYWLLSACTDVTIDATARLGSVGVVVAIKPKSDDDPIEIVNTASPLKRVDYASEDGKKVVVKELDALADVFISSVAEFRNVTTAVVTKDFGKGGILVGSDAVNAGMADRIGSFEELLSELSEGGKSMPKKYDGTAVSLKETDPEVYDEIFNAGVEAGKETTQTEASAKLDALKTENDSLKTANKELTEKVVALEKKEAIREEQTIVSVANAIVSDRLAESTVSKRLHGKIKAFIDHSKFVVDGKLDVDAFKVSVDQEVSDWEDSASPIDGVGSSEETVKIEDVKEVDETVARLAKLAE